MNVENTFDQKQYASLLSKPVFVQPTMYKMAVQESEMISDDEMNMDEWIYEKESIKQIEEKCYKMNHQPSSMYCNWN